MGGAEALGGPLDVDAGGAAGEQSLPVDGPAGGALLHLWIPEPQWRAAGPPLQHPAALPVLLRAALPVLLRAALPVLLRGSLPVLLRAALHVLLRFGFVMLEHVYLSSITFS